MQAISIHSADRHQRVADLSPSGGVGDPPVDPGDDAPAGTPGTGENLCPQCNGNGRQGDGECPTCGGSGKVVTGIGGG